MMDCPRIDAQEGSTSSNGASERAEILRLLCAYVSESLRVTEQWASAHSIHHTDVRAMAVLGEGTQGDARMTAGALGAALGLSSPATSALIARLESAGHLIRERDPHDRRRVLLKLSQSASRGATEYFRPLGDAVDGALANTAHHDQAVILSFLQRLTDEMDALSDT